MNNFSGAFMRYELTTNVANTEFLLQLQTGHQPRPGVKISTNGMHLENVEQFTYLDSVLESNVSSDNDVDNRINTAQAAWGKLFENPGLTHITKLMVYWAIVISTLLYSCETWVLYQRDLH